MTTTRTIHVRPSQDADPVPVTHQAFPEDLEEARKLWGDAAVMHFVVSAFDVALASRFRGLTKRKENPLTAAQAAKAPEVMEFKPSAGRSKKSPEEKVAEALAKAKEAGLSKAELEKMLAEMDD